jgi:hypothetical protein
MIFYVISTLSCRPAEYCSNYFIAPVVHCEKSLFVLAFRQKIPVLRTENPAVDTRTICLLPIEFF